MTDLRFALLCRRLAEENPELSSLFIDADSDNVRAILTGLLNSKLKVGSFGNPKIVLYVIGR